MSLITSMSSIHLGIASKATEGVTATQPPPSFECQIIGAGAGGPSYQAGGGGGGGQFIQGTKAISYSFSTPQTYKIQIGARQYGKNTSSTNSTILEVGLLSNGYTTPFVTAYYGGYGATYGSSGAPISTYGSTGGGTYTPYNQNYAPDLRWAPGFKNTPGLSTLGSQVSYANTGGLAWSGAMTTNNRYSSGGGGGAGGAGNPGVSNLQAGTGGPGILDWTGTYVCYGGGGISSMNNRDNGVIAAVVGSGPKTQATYSGGAVPAAVLAVPSGLDNTGGGGSWGGSGGSGKFILRYPDKYRLMYGVTGTYTYYKSGGYHYYVFTGSGTFRFLK